MPLNVTVTPGKRFATGEAIDNSKLNQAAAPTVAIEGGVSTAQIDAAAVTVAKTGFEADAAYAAYAAFHQASGRLPVGDVVARGPVFDVRAFGDTAIWDGVADAAPAINRAIAAAIAAGGGTILFPAGEYNLLTPGDTSTGWKRMLYAYSATAVRLTFRGARGGGTRLFHGYAGSASHGVTLLHLEGALVDTVVEDLFFEETSTSATAWLTEGMTVYDSLGTMRNVTVRGNHFRNFGRGVYYGCAGLRILENEFTYPLGRPGPTGVPAVCIHMEAVNGPKGAQDVQIVGNRCIGTETLSVLPIDGLCTGRALGWLVKGNIIRRVWAEGIFIGARQLSNGAVPSWSAEEREVVIEGNTIDYDEAVTDAVTTQIRIGIFCWDARATIVGNRIRNCYAGISVNNYDYSGGDDAGTRMRDFTIANNVITMASDLKMSDAYTLASGRNGRVGIAMVSIGEATIQGNVVRFPGRGSTALATKYWPARGISLSLCDNVLVTNNVVSGGIAAASTDRVQLMGISLETSRYCEVAGNRLRQLNMGINGAWEPNVNTPTGNEIGENRMDDVVWGYAAMGAGSDGTLNPTNNSLIKKFVGSGYRSRKQKVSFVPGTAGWIRVATFTGFPVFRARVWSEELPYPCQFELQGSYIPGGGTVSGSLTCEGAAFYGQLIDKARLCTNDPSTDGHVHLDLSVYAFSAGQRVWVEIESAGHMGGAWSEPATVALTRTGFTGALAAGLLELSMAHGYVAPSQLKQSPTWSTPWRLGRVYVWQTGVYLRYKMDTAPAGDGDGYVWEAFIP